MLYCGASGSHPSGALLITSSQLRIFGMTSVFPQERANFRCSLTFPVLILFGAFPSPLFFISSSVALILVAPDPDNVGRKSKSALSGSRTIRMFYSQLCPIEQEVLLAA